MLVEIDIAARLEDPALIAAAGLIDQQAPDLAAVAGELVRLHQRDARAGRNSYGPPSLPEKYVPPDFAVLENSEVTRVDCW